MFSMVKPWFLSALPASVVPDQAEEAHIKPAQRKHARERYVLAEAIMEYHLVTQRLAKIAASGNGICRWQAIARDSDGNDHTC